DHPTLIAILLVVLAMALGFGWWQTRQTKFLAGAVGAVIPLLIIWLLGLWYPSDAQKIEVALQEMSAGVRGGDLDRIFRQVSEKFQQGPPTFGSELNKKGFRDLST